MARLKPFILALALVVLATTAHAKKAEVNYDDPNLAFTSEYVGDTAASCPKTLKGKALKACLTRLGFASSEEISPEAEVLSSAAPHSLH